MNYSFLFCIWMMGVEIEVLSGSENTWRRLEDICCGNNNKDKDNSPKTLNDKMIKIIKLWQLNIVHFTNLVMFFWLFQGVLSSPRRLSSWFSLLMNVPRTFSLLLNQCVSTSWTQANCGKLMFRPFINMLLTKTCFSVQITHSSIKCIWFALLSQQKFDGRPHFKPGAPGSFFYHFE